MYVYIYIWRYKKFVKTAENWNNYCQLDTSRNTWFSRAHLVFAPGGYYCANRLFPGAFDRSNTCLTGMSSSLGA